MYNKEYFGRQLDKCLLILPENISHKVQNELIINDWGIKLEISFLIAFSIVFQKRNINNNGSIIFSGK